MNEQTPNSPKPDSDSDNTPLNASEPGEIYAPQSPIPSDIHESLTRLTNVSSTPSPVPLNEQPGESNERNEDLSDDDMVTKPSSRPVTLPEDHKQRPDNQSPVQQQQNQISQQSPFPEESSSSLPQRVEEVDPAATQVMSSA